MCIRTTHGAHPARGCAVQRQSCGSVLLCRRRPSTAPRPAGPRSRPTRRRQLLPPLKKGAGRRMASDGGFAFDSPWTMQQQDQEQIPRGALCACCPLFQRGLSIRLSSKRAGAGCSACRHTTPISLLQRPLQPPLFPPSKPFLPSSLPLFPPAMPLPSPLPPLFGASLPSETPSPPRFPPRQSPKPSSWPLFSPATPQKGATIKPAPSRVPLFSPTMTFGSPTSKLRAPRASLFSSSMPQKAATMLPGSSTDSTSRTRSTRSSVPCSKVWHFIQVETALRRDLIQALGTW